MLTRLLKSHLAPYRKQLLLIVVLQTVQTTAALTLPTINANIIDKGVLRGNQGYIWTWGAVMVVFSIIQIVFAVAAVYWGASEVTFLSSASASPAVVGSPASAMASMRSASM